MYNYFNMSHKQAITTVLYSTFPRCLDFVKWTIQKRAEHYYTVNDTNELKCIQSLNEIWIWFAGRGLASDGQTTGRMICNGVWERECNIWYDMMLHVQVRCEPRRYWLVQLLLSFVAVAYMTCIYTLCFYHVTHHHDKMKTACSNIIGSHSRPNTMRQQNPFIYILFIKTLVQYTSRRWRTTLIGRLQDQKVDSYRVNCNVIDPQIVVHEHLNSLTFSRIYINGTLKPY